jgi:replication factor C subunit 2/4
MPVEMEEVINEGASTSSGTALTKQQEKKKSLPWIEKYRPQVFEDIMGKFILN